MTTAAIAVPPLSIVHIITRFIRGGADENTLLTCNGQAAAGHRVHLIVGAETHPDMLARLDPRVVAYEMPSLRRAISPIADLVSLYLLVRLFRRVRPRIVHTHESKAGIVGRWAAWLARVPVIVHGVHILAFVGNSGFSRHLFLAIERMTARITDAFIDVSEGMRAECLAAGVGREDDHFVVASGMDIAKFREAARPAHWSEILDEDLLVPDAVAPLFVLMTGALEPRKRMLEFLPVFAKVRWNVPAAVLLIAGEGHLMTVLKRRIEELGLQGKVIALGHRDDLEKFIALAEVCIHAAEREGLPRVVVQYVAGGRPVVTTALPGIGRVVGDGVNGFNVALDDVDGIGVRLEQLLLDSDLRTKFHEAALAVDLSKWDSQEMVDHISVIYSLLLERRDKLK